MDQIEPKTSKQSMWVTGAVAVVILIGGAFFLTRSVSSPATNQNTTQENQPTQSSVIPTETTQNGSLNTPVKEFTMTAKMYEFSPSTITVSEGDKIKLTINSLDVPHGFAIDELDIKKDIAVGEPTIVEFTATKKGTFRFYCSLFCGSGHKEMEGKIEVQ